MLKRYLVFDYMVGEYDFEEGEHHEYACNTDTLMEAIDLLANEPHASLYRAMYWLDLQERRYSSPAEEIQFSSHYQNRVKFIEAQRPKPVPDRCPPKPYTLRLIQRPNFTPLKFLAHVLGTNKEAPPDARSEEEKRADFLRSCRVL